MRCKIIAMSRMRPTDDPRDRRVARLSIAQHGVMRCHAEIVVTGQKVKETVLTVMTIM